MGLPVDFVPHIRRQANRAYVQALIDDRGLTVEAIDAYADWLVNRYYLDRPREREVLRAAIVAYMDGWDQGYDEGYPAGLGEGEEVGRGAYRDRETGSGGGGLDGPPLPRARHALRALTVA